MRLIPNSLLAKLLDYPGTVGVEARDKIANLLSDVATKKEIELFYSAINLYNDNSYSKNIFIERSEIKDTWDPNISHLQNSISASLGSWLSDDILLMSDKLAMAHSVEGRSPFLDTEVANASFQMRDEFKFSGNRNKIVLREVASKILPNEIFSAPKRPFYIPLDDYMKDRRVESIYEHYLSEKRIKQRGLLNYEWMLQQQYQMKKGDFVAQKRVFAILCLEIWFQQNIPEYEV